jgi:phosphoglycolate phosphatase-like HAD superfamily hydrolase
MDEAKMRFQQNSSRRLSTFTPILYAILIAVRANAQIPPLSSWNEGAAKQAIIAFVREVTNKSGTKYVAPQDRIAVFDQDGTLWVEHPLYTQAIFALARVHELAPQHPEWKERQPFKAVLANDREPMDKFSESDWELIVAATHSGMSIKDFQEIEKQWLAGAKDGRFHRPYTELVYQPMLEVMRFLRDNGFKTYIVTGGGQEFVRVYSQHVYGILPEQVIGSSFLTKYQYANGKPVLMREPQVFFVDDHAGKPIGINLFIGQRPYAAFGNSTGDQQMLEWTQAGNGARLMMLVLHDDPNREYAYGPAGGLPNTKVGTFSDALMAEAKRNGWIVISMKKDWKRVFDFQQ